MIRKNRQLAEQPHFCRVNLNFAINPETVPTLIPAKALEILQKGDDNPYYVVEEIFDIREKANGIEYTPEFWKSYLDKLKNTAIPGAKSGHTSPYEWWITGDTDLYVIGGELKGNSVYLKMYIPPMGFSSSNETFIKNVQAGMVHFSIVSWIEKITETDENGNIQSIKAVRSVKGERNDAVERDMGAMPQKVNRDNPDESGKNKSEVYIMSENTLTDIIKNLNNQITNGTVSKLDIAKHLGIEVLTDVHKNAVKDIQEIKAIVGDDPISKIKEMNTTAEKVKKQAYDNSRETLMNKEFGPLKIKVNGEEKDNLMRCAAEKVVSAEIQDDKSLADQVEKAKSDPVVLAMSKTMADLNSDFNNITSPGPGKTTEKQTGMKIVKS